MEALHKIMTPTTRASDTMVKILMSLGQFLFAPSLCTNVSKMVDVEIPDVL